MPADRTWDFAGGLVIGLAAAHLGSGGGGGSLLFLVAMLAGMVAAPAVRRGMDRLAATSRRHAMEIRHLTDRYAVSPQIAPEDVAALKAAGFVRVICNRPDGEIPAPLQAAAVRAAVAAAGLDFVDNPVLPGGFTPEVIATQARAMEAEGPVFAYCASGNRSSIVWALAQAGKRTADDLIATAARWGYNLEPLRARLG